EKRTPQRGPREPSFAKSLFASKASSPEKGSYPSAFFRRCAARARCLARKNADRTTKCEEKRASFDKKTSGMTGCPVMPEEGRDRRSRQMAENAGKRRVGLQRAEEVQDVRLLGCGERREVVHGGVRLGALRDRLNERLEPDAVRRELLEVLHGDLILTAVGV